MSPVIAVVNQKGGVGKTATTCNLSCALASRGKQVAVLDLDPQGHLSASLGVTEWRDGGVDSLIFEGEELGSVQSKVRENLFLVPPGQRLGELESSVKPSAEWGFRLREALAGQLSPFDYLLIDCPPASGMLVMNALMAADQILTPVVGDYLGLRGLSHLMMTLQRVQAASGKSYRHDIVLTRYHSRGRLAREVRDKLMTYFPGKVLATPVREIVAIAEAPSYGKSIFEYRRSSHGATDYGALAEDFLTHRVM